MNKKFNYKIQKKITEAIQLYSSGEIVGAKALCKKVLKIDPKNIDILNLYGVCFSHEKDDTKGLIYIERALSINPKHVNTLSNRGLLLKNLDRFEEALESYDKVLALNPRHINTLSNRGNVLLDLGRFEEALESCDKALAINPKHINALINRSNALMGLARINEALKGLARINEALKGYDKALALNPKNVDALSNRGNVLLDLDRPKEALESYDKVLALNPRHINTLSNRGNVLLDLDCFEEALESCDKALLLDPNHVNTLSNRGNILVKLDRFEEALESYNNALLLDPNHVDVHSNRGGVLKNLGRFKEEFESYDRALALDPKHVGGNWNRSLAYLRAGNLHDGWKSYSWRKHRKEFSQLRKNYTQPIYEGRDLQDKTLYIYPEQGIGDEVMFVSCLQDIIKQPYKQIILECDKRLVPLISRSFPQITVININTVDKNHIHFDFHCAIADLPSFFRKTVHDFPQKSSYLTPDNEQIRHWKNRFQKLGGNLNIGISWKGGKDILLQKQRSFDLQVLEPILRQDINVINLQYGDHNKEIADFEGETGITVHDWPDADPLNDLDGFAAQIAALDLVISIDNSTVHMAGALGTPVWTLLPKISNWRWLLDREDSPWYPSMKLFRQKEHGDWLEVINRIQNELEPLVKKGRL